jgi:hypothetical protein
MNLSSSRFSSRSAELVLHRFVSANISAGGRTFGGNAASPDLQSDGYALDLLGGDLSRLQGPAAPLLWQHDTNSIAGRILSISATATEMPFQAELLAPGASAVADKLARELRGGAPYGASLSFTIDEWEPIVPGKPKAGRCATKWTALELSLCSVPVDPKAIVTSRARRNRNMDAFTAAQAHAEQAVEAHRAVGRHNSEMADALERLQDHHRALGTGLRAFRRALEAGDAEQAIECQSRCSRSIAGVAHESRLLRGRHDDAMEAHAGLARAMEDADSALIQTSGGMGDDQGSRSYRRRQVELSRLRVRDDDFSRRQRDLEKLRLNAPTA